MLEQPRYGSYPPLQLRPPLGSVAHDEALEPPRLPLTAALLARGKERFEIHCAPCHGESGDGHGMIVDRGMIAPPSYDEARLRSAPDSYFLDVIAHGYGAMFPYEARVAPADRAAIVAYIRALQLSQHAPVSRLTQDERRKLEEVASR
jgi:mono/diheme cytochrome c family protein